MFRGRRREVLRDRFSKILSYWLGNLLGFVDETKIEDIDLEVI